MSDARPPAGRRRLGGVLALVIALLVPVGLIGWFVGQPVLGGDDGGERERSSRGEPSASAPTSSLATEPAPDRSQAPLTGTVVVIDPGHNPGNQHHSSEIARSVEIGTSSKECDTAGTTTNSGYSEARFTLDVSHRIREILEKRGATVKFTQDRDRAYGPCITERAEIGNRAKADAVVSVHADGAEAGARGFHVILPARVHQGTADTREIVGPSARLGRELASAFARQTGSSPANYLTHEDGLVTRSDLGGLNLTQVPKVFIECGNMRDREDAEQLTDARWRGRAARGIADGITAFLNGNR